MFRKSFLNVSLSDSEEIQESSKSISFLNISIRSTDEIPDHLFDTDVTVQSNAVSESKVESGKINSF